MSDYTGGIRWRKLNATWPLAKLAIGRGGLTVTPARRGLRFLGLPTVRLQWSDPEKIEPVKGLLPGSSGVSFIVGGKRLIFWSPRESAKILDELKLYASEKIAPRERRVL